MRLATCVLILSLAAPGLAQEEQEAKTFRATVNVVVVPTVVTDRDGRYVVGLKASDFRLLDNDKLQDIKVDEIYQPLSMVMVVQADTAMESVLPRIQKIAPMLTPLVTGQQGEIAIISFDHRIQVLQDFTSDTDKLKEAMSKLKPGGEYSRMKDAIREAARMLSKRSQTNRRVILYIGETRDKSSSGKTREILAELQLHNIMVYTVNVNRLLTTITKKAPPPRPDPIPAGGRHVPPGVANIPTNTANLGMPTGSVIPLFIEIFKDVRDIFVRNPAEAFTQFTGGREYSFISQRDLETAVQAVGDDIRSQYMISYNPNNKIEGGFHEIKVLIAREGAERWKVRARPGYWMAGVPE
jgi:Ca-activated chloride channel family protein